MKILLAHNEYQQPGGEDQVFQAEKALLTRHHHQVLEYVRDNSEIGDRIVPRVRTGFRAIWASDSYADLLELISKEKPDIAHFHNTFPLISPAAYYACRQTGVPVVQSLHNARMLCPAATFFRKGRICQDCVGRVFAWPGILHACYRGSRVETAAVAAMLTLHRFRRTWENLVDLYIVFSDFYRRKFIETGLSPNKVVVKPHFVDLDPGPRSDYGSYAVFVGRLAPEKGVPLLLEAWRQLGAIPLKLRGEGPLEPIVREFVARDGRVQLLPRLSREDLLRTIQAARMLVIPSQGFYETFGLVVAEAFACSVPVLASRAGVLEEIVTDGRTGLHFTAGDPNDLAAKVEWAWAHPSEMEVMGRAARAEYEAKYTGERNYEILMDIYRQAANRNL